MHIGNLFHRILQAMLLLEGMREAGGELLPDVVSFNTCIKACGQASMIAEALQAKSSKL